MKKSLYRQVMLVISLVCFLLLMLIAIKLKVFEGISICILFKALGFIIKNSFVEGILCSILAVLIIYFTQVYHSKKKIKKDFRCNEIISDVYSGIEEYCKLKKQIPEIDENISNEDYCEKRRSVSLRYYEFYKKNLAEVNIITLNFSFPNNDILIDSVQSCFFINLNFELLGIVNNIKNRLPNLRNNYPKIKEMFEKYELENEEKELLKLGDMLQSYFVDLRFMAIYWNELLDYLGYDPTYNKMYIDIYNRNYDLIEDINLPKEVRYARYKKVDREVKKAIFRYKIGHFWTR